MKLKNEIEKLKNEIRIENERFKNEIWKLNKNIDDCWREWINTVVEEHKTMDTYKYRLTQKTKYGNIDHYFHEDREEQLIKLIQYCNQNNIEYELNDKAKEFHNKLYNMILKGE